MCAFLNQDKISKKQLLEIVVSYKRINKINKEEVNSSVNKHLATSTTIKPSQQLVKLESEKYSHLSSSLENSLADASYFNGILDDTFEIFPTPQQIFPSLNSNLPFLTRISPSMKRLCLTELSTQGQLTDISIYVFCVSEHANYFIWFVYFRVIFYLDNLKEMLSIA